MTRTVRPARSGIAGKFLQFLVLKADEKTAKLAHESLKTNTLMKYAEEHGVVDDKGHLIVTLEAPMTIGGVVYTGFMRQRKAPLKFVEEKAEALLRQKKLYDKATSTEVYLDQDKIYAMQQEGLITEAELDSFFEVDESFAFVPVKE